MLYRETKPGEFSPWGGEAIDGIYHPLDIEICWTSAALARMGLYVPAEPDPLPQGKIEVGRSVQRVDGQVKWVVEMADKPFDHLKPVNFKLGMLTLNVTPDQVDDYIAQMPEPDQMIAKIYWTSAQKFERGDPLIEQIGTAFGKTPEEIDRAWRYAMEL